MNAETQSREKMSPKHAGVFRRPICQCWHTTQFAGLIIRSDANGAT
jgi:hypothetical protein